MALSRHAGFFASLQRLEDRLALEDKEQQSTGTMTAASPLVFVDHQAASATTTDSSGPALDFLALTRQGEETDAEQEEDDINIERLMALLGLSPPQDVYGAGCDCSGADGFLANVVGVVGPKCDGEKRRLDAWIQHYHRPSSDGGRACREAARLAHLLLAKASSSSWDGRAFPSTVKEFLDHDAPSTE